MFSFIKKMGKKSPLTCLVIGAGIRGNCYAQYARAYPEEVKVVSVAEPVEARRSKMVERHGIPEEKVFSDWKQAAELERFADFAVITTVDQLHKEPAVAFAKLGYHILLEKPMAVTEEDCREIVNVCNENKVQLAVGHVLRYSPWALKIKSLIDAGEIGEVVSIRHTEPVGYWHFAHSYVRGNWRNEATSSFSLLTKSCHDIDLINSWMSPRKCVRVSSFGHLSHFTKENKPPKASSRCMDCKVESKCPFSAKRFYLDRVEMGNTGWPVSVVSDVTDIESVSEALRTGPYGKCVYDTDNDVMSHQVVNMQYDNGATVAFNMVAFTKRVCAREVKIYGTKGEIDYEDGWGHVQLFNFLSEKTYSHPLYNEHSMEMRGHGGADYHLMKNFVDSLRGKSQVLTGPQETLDSHLLAFAADKARKENRVVEIGADGQF